IPIDVPPIDSILDTRSDKISFGKTSSDFFRIINATKSPEGWKVPKPDERSGPLNTWIFGIPFLQ
ncbi:3143_t:CDS:2, partial [Cetraspora pellucida]